MSSNLNRFKDELNNLIILGDRLLAAMRRDIVGNVKFDKALEQKLGKDKSSELIKSFPDFYSEYDAWYSESLAVVRQLLPDRFLDFKSFYEKPKNRKTIEYGNYVIQDYLQRIQVMFREEVRVGKDAAYSQFEQQLSILKSTSKRFKSSLFEIKQIVQYDLFDSEIDAARALLKNGFLRAAGAISGVVIEKHLAQVCIDHSILIKKKNPGIGDLNDLLKGASVIDMTQWRQISFLADIRNICDHNKLEEPTKEQVKDLIDGADKLLKTIS